MAPMTLPQAEMDRIEKEADAIFNPKDLPICTPEIAHHLGELCSAFIAGAKAEAVRGREQERTRFIEFLQWLSAEKAEYSILYGGDPERFCSIDHDYTSEQIADLYILDTQKRKG